MWKQRKDFYDINFYRLTCCRAKVFSSDFPHNWEIMQKKKRLKSFRWT